MIDPKHLTLAKLLEGRLFRIPEYQRAYSWTSRERADLFRDVESVLKSQGSDMTHFMATVVVLRRDRKKILADEFEVVEVVDGQQRLTTIVVLLRAISKALSESVPAEIKLKRQLDELLVKGDDLSLLLLQTNHDTSNVFVDYLRHGQVPASGTLATAAGRHLAEAITECETFLNRFKSEKLIELAGAMRNRLSFILHGIDDERTVYTVFEVLNSRGLPVAWFDRLKSMLMQIAFEDATGNSGEHGHEIHATWQEIYRALGVSPGLAAEALKFSAVLKTGKRRKGKLLGEEESAQVLRQWCGGKAKSAIAVSRWLAEVIEALHRLKRNRRLGAVTRMSQARFTAIAVMLSPLSELEQERVLDAWETTCFRVFGIARKDARTLSGKLIALGIGVFGGTLSADEVIARLREIGEEELPSGLIRAQLQNRNCYDGWASELHYLMLRYEEHLAALEGERVHEDTWEKIWNAKSDDTIEHVLPQANANAKGLTKGGVLVHRLGNLLVLPPGINSSLGAKPFAEKAAIYAKSSLRSVRAVGSLPSWTLSEIEQREATLIDWIGSALLVPS